MIMCAGELVNDCHNLGGSTAAEVDATDIRSPTVCTATAPLSPSCSCRSGMLILVNKSAHEGGEPLPSAATDSEGAAYAGNRETQSYAESIEHG